MKTTFGLKHEDLVPLLKLAWPLHLWRIYQTCSTSHAFPIRAQPTRSVFATHLPTC